MMAIKVPQDRLVRDGDFSWTPDAVARLNRVPEGFMRKATKGRVEKAAKARSVDVITLEICEEGIAEGRKVMEELIRKQNAEKEQSGDSNTAASSTPLEAPDQEDD